MKMMKVRHLGEEQARPHMKKVRVTISGDADQISEKIADDYGIMSDTVEDNLYRQISGIEIDLWVDTETGNVTVDGAWN